MAKKIRKKKGEATAKPTPPRQDGAWLGADMRLRYRLLIVIAVLVAGVCVLYPEVVFQDKVFSAADNEAAKSYATPIQAEMERCNCYPLWNPYLFGGMPSYESLSYTPHVYPLSVVVYVLVRVFQFPGMTWLLFHIFLLGLGVAVLLMDRGVHYLIAASAGVLMMWMPNYVAIGAHGHGSQAIAIAFMPFALLVWDRLWRGKGDILVNAALLIIILGFQFLRAHLQITYYTMALIALHALFFGVLQIIDAARGRDGEAHFTLLRRASTPVRGAITNVAIAALILAVIVAAALAMSAVLFLPVEDYAQYSIRGQSESGGLDYDYATSWSLHPAETLTFVVPFAFGFGKFLYFGKMPFTDYPNYLGIVVLMFAVIGVMLVRTRFVRFLVFVAVVTTFVAFGKYLPVLYDPLFKFLPHFDKFRVPVMVLIVQQLAVVILFAIGLKASLTADAAVWRRRSVIVVAAGAVFFFVALVTRGYWTGEFARSVAPGFRFARDAATQLSLAVQAGDYLHKDLVKQALILIAASATMLLYFRGTLTRSLTVFVVLGVALLDFYLVDRHVLYPERLFNQPAYQIVEERAERDEFLEPDPLIEFLQQDDDYYRVFPLAQNVIGGDFQNNRYMNFGIASIGGYHPAKLAIYQNFMEALAIAVQRGDLRAINPLNVKYVITVGRFPENDVLKPVWEGKDYSGQNRIVYENVQMMPRVFFMDRYEVVSDERAQQMIAGGDWEPATTVLLDREPGVPPQSKEGATAEITQYRFNEIRIKAQMPQAAILVLSEIYYPKWRVWVDGEPAEMLRADYVLRAVALPAGEHEIVFAFESDTLRKGLMISLTGMTLALACLFIGVSRTMKVGRKWKPSS